jgi:hypothetical protein
MPHVDTFVHFAPEIIPSQRCSALPTCGPDQSRPARFVLDSRPFPAHLSVRGPATPSIFISYRRQDAEVYAGRLYDRLAQEFGENNVFMDVDTLQPGEDYVKAIERKLRHIDIFLAVIGDRWVTVTDDQGARGLITIKTCCASKWRPR